MLDRIIRFSIKNKLVVGLFTLILINWGAYSLSQLPVDALPDITNNQVQIITKVPTLAAQEVEQFITYPVERAMSNLPGLVEMRSMSRFGLSVITIVFDDATNIYFARQQITERIRKAEENIPPGMAKPELAPVTTGLGEIYQYSIHPRKGSEQKYSAMDLRTMQDWIVARQLYGIAGVAEVTGFGGVTKQYEVTVNPDQLKAMNISISEVFTALERNNENTGGAYIEKKPNAYFIRGVGLMMSIKDIETTLVKRVKGVPILIRDIATVQFGSPPRYGAMTYNGEEEVVGGLVLMLKGANSADVVARVKERMVLVQKSLPADVVIEPFLDRTHLIQRAINTVKKNLVEGALIVIFVLVVFLGNIRAGLIVASAIPLSLLFAFGMMHIFKVSANLMSLGAIDFGLIVDGAVIIVEAVMHHMALTSKGRVLTQAEMDDEVYHSASKIRSSAAFGEIIILIVYIPILSLVGIEGRMFKPMAETVSFAIIGALLLSLTYIPMATALFLSKKPVLKKSRSEKMMEFLERKYTPLLQLAIKFKYAIVLCAFALLVIVVILFGRMGGEFIPQLEEGDFAVEFVLPQSASLSQTKEVVMQAERMLLKQIPEVKMVVGKTGSADVATDPMPPNASDLMVILKDKKQWRKGKDFNGLSKEIEETLSVIPGVIVEPSQPIQMRFNELMTGVKQDVAVKIFGENLDSLHDLAGRVAAAIKPIPGLSQPVVERISGLPQITVKYDRARLAVYNLNITDVNKIVSAAFAGFTAGAIYENERKFDLAVRMDSSHRLSLDNVASLYIPIEEGGQIPLSQIATVSYASGPAQISREEGRRRIVIGFNVAGRDVKSVVEDVQKTLSNKVKLPVGYYYKYGGAFENLQRASDRLMIAVPVALLLIFILLYLTFRSLKQATLIFTAIPMSAIGGVFALLIRDMPFSISAGVGFIALFGVAVLNGIVLIGTFNQLEKEGITDVMERVLTGTKIRLRPVLMTAAVASLGFLPMAMSTSAGAEVQKPLATVVIGGLITATILTLVVLPLLYIIFSRMKIRKHPAALPVLVMVSIAICPLTGRGQTANNAMRITFAEAYDIALQNNLQLKSSAIALQKSQVMTNTYFSMPKTGVFAENEDMRPYDTKGILKIGLSQAVEWPGLYTARRSLLTEQMHSVEYAKQLRAVEIKKNVEAAYYTLWYHQSRQSLWRYLDSFYLESARMARLRVKTGESAGLDSLSATAKSQEIHLQMEAMQNDIRIQQTSLKALLNTDASYLAVNAPLDKVEVQMATKAEPDHPALLLQQQSVNVARADIRVNRMYGRPDFSGRFFSQTLYGLSNPYSGFSVTMAMPLLDRKSLRNKVSAARLEADYQQTIYDFERQVFDAQLQQLLLALEKSRMMLQYYEQTGLRQSGEIIKAATLAYEGGEISFAELSQYLNQAVDIRKNYLDALNQYNQNAIQLNYYLNRQ